MFPQVKKLHGKQVFGKENLFIYGVQAYFQAFLFPCI